jgi:transcriptional regulator with XRE-family HTH domain
MNLSHIRSNIKKLRRAKGTTQREMALRLYMDERTYAKIERGVNKSMDIRLISAIADILDTDVVSLLKDSHTHSETISQEQTVESPESEKTFTGNNVPNHEHAKLLQEIMALKAEVRELIAVQKKAMKLLKL